LKSTLLQLDSTFTERDYGASSFRDFMEKVAQSGAVALKHAGRSMLVESREDGAAEVEAVVGAAEKGFHAPPAEAPAAAVVAAPAAHDDTDEEETLPPSPMSMQDGIKALQRAFNQAAPPPRWPMYVRQAKQFLRNAIEGFDERKYGFASVVDLLRAAGREGVVRIERDRQGAVRVFPGAGLEARSAPAGTSLSGEPAGGDAPVDIEEVPAGGVDAEASPAFEPIVEPPIVEAQVEPEPSSDDEELEDEGVNGNRIDGNTIAPAGRDARKRRPATSRAPRMPRAAKAVKTPRPRGARKTTRS
jgi:hypothetical protein